MVADAATAAAAAAAAGLTSPSVIWSPSLGFFRPRTTRDALLPAYVMQCTAQSPPVDASTSQTRQQHSTHVAVLPATAAYVTAESKGWAGQSARPCTYTWVAVATISMSSPRKTAKAAGAAAGRGVGATTATSALPTRTARRLP